MFGNKNSAVPYVRIGGVDRQSVLTSNANGNTPVKEIGVNANGNLIFSTDLTTFKSVLDLKYSQFKSNDENQEDTWETEKSVSMKATDGTSTTQLTVTPTGAKVNDKEIATTDKLPNLENYLDLTKTTVQSVAGQIIFNSDRIYCSQGIRNKAGDNIAGVIANHMTFGNPNFKTRILGNTVRPKYATVYSTSASSLQDLALLSDVPSVQQSTGTSTTATMSQNAITSAIPTKTSQLTNDSNFATTSQIPDISGKANLSGGNTFSGTQTFNNGIILANDTAINNASGNNVITTQTGGHTILGDPNGLINIQGSNTRPLYTKKDSGSEQLALYKDIPNYFTTAGKTGGNTSGSLKLTAGHLYRIYVGNGDAQLACLVKMPNPMAEQYWFMGMNLYGHYCRLHISSAGAVKYQYANIGQTNWTDNNSVYITYEDITSKN